jgi:hypothetical protein
MLRLLIALLALASVARAEHHVIVEAEEFKIVRGPFRVIGIEEAYYAATLSNTFSSRQKLLSAPESGPLAEAVKTVEIPAAGRYRLWSRYELPADWTAEHTIRVEQRGKVVVERRYGLAENKKVWTMGGGFVPFAHFTWGSGDNIVWEPSDPIELAAGPARVTILAGPQAPSKDARGPARRNLDVLAFTDDLEFGLKDPEKHTWHEVDHLLAQEGECWLRLTAPADAPAPLSATLAIMAHNPYWNPRFPFQKQIDALPPGTSSAWIPIGQGLDRLNMQELDVDGKYKPAPGKPAPPGMDFTVELAADAQGKRLYRRVRFHEPELTKLVLEVPADLRNKSPGIRTIEEWHEELLKLVKTFPPHGRVPTEVPVFGIMGGPWLLRPTKSRERRRELADETGLLLGRNTWRDGELSPELIEKFGVKPLANLEFDLRGLPPEKLEKELVKLRDAGELQRAKVINLGDEIYPSVPAAPKSGPAFYHTMREAIDKWTATLKALTDVVEKIGGHGLSTGANFSPHPQYWPVAWWFTTFRGHGMTMPWSEDWVFQVPEASTEIVGYMCDAMRAAADPDRPIEMYNIPHWPGQTVRDLTLSFFTALAHGNKIVNFYTIKPIYDYTENWVAWENKTTWRAAYDLVRDLGVGDDLIARGRVRPAEVGLLQSTVGDLYDWFRQQTWPNFERKAIWYALRNAQVPVDFVTEEDVADGKIDRLKVLYVVNDHLLGRAAARLTKWVERGGTLISLAGGPLRDEEDAISPAISKLLGVNDALLAGTKKNCWAKECLAWEKPVVQLESGVPALLTVAHLGLRDGVQVRARFVDGAPAIVEQASGKGRAVTFAFLPGAAYLQKAFPQRPFCRGTSDDAFNHFLPTEFDERAGELIVEPARALARHVTVKAGETPAQVDAETIDAPAGIAVPIANYSGKPMQATVEVSGAAGVKSVESARAGKLQFRLEGDRLTTELPLEWGDLLVLRR